MLIAYKTDDGRYFDDEKEAEDHEKELELRSSLEIILDEAGELEKDRFINYILLYKYSIFDALKKSLADSGGK